MEKILFAVDADGVNMHTLDFATYLCRLTRSGITGMFLEKLASDPAPLLKKLFSFSEHGRLEDDDLYTGPDEKNRIEKEISLFRDTCDNRSLRYTIMQREGDPVREISRETRFSDLLIMDAFSSCKNSDLQIPTNFVKDVLQETECPVIIAPPAFEKIDEIIFTYNGSRSSVFAMKQFAYLFPELNEKRLIIVQANEKGIWDENEKTSLKDLFRNHFSSIGFEILSNAQEDELFGFLLVRKNAFIVMGAYGRAAISRFFKRSYADRLIRTMTQPLFIAHT